MYDNAKKVLTRALSCIAVDGYLSKSAALYTEDDATSVKVLRSLELSPDLSPDEITVYGLEVDKILDWILSVRLAVDDDYLSSCRNAVTMADDDMAKASGFICSLPNAYKNYLSHYVDFSSVTVPNDFEGDPGTRLEDLRCTVITSTINRDYTKVFCVSPTGHLITFYDKPTKKKEVLQIFAAGDIISITSSIGKNKFSDPFETVLSRPKITKI